MNFGNFGTDSNFVGIDRNCGIDFVGKNLNLHFGFVAKNFDNNIET